MRSFIWAREVGLASPQGYKNKNNFFQLDKIANHEIRSIWPISYGRTLFWETDKLQFAKIALHGKKTKKHELKSIIFGVRAKHIYARHLP